MKFYIFFFIFSLGFCSYSNQGYDLYLKGEYNKAYIRLKQELKNDYSINNLNLMGACCYQLNKPNEAEKYYLKCLIRDKKNIYALSNLAILYFDKNDLSNLNIISYKLIKYYPKRFYGYLGRAYYLYKNKEFDKAYTQIQIVKNKIKKNDPLLDREENDYFFMLYLDIKKKIIASK